VRDGLALLSSPRLHVARSCAPVRPGRLVTVGCPAPPPTRPHPISAAPLAVSLTLWPRVDPPAHKPGSSRAARLLRATRAAQPAGPCVRLGAVEINGAGQQRASGSRERTDRQRQPLRHAAPKKATDALPLPCLPPSVVEARETTSPERRTRGSSPCCVPTHSTGWWRGSRRPSRGGAAFASDRPGSRASPRRGPAPPWSRSSGPPPEGRSRRCSRVSGRAGSPPCSP
jgi:hypothetical protein